MAGELGRGKGGSAVASRSRGVVLPTGVSLNESDFGRVYDFEASGSKLKFKVFGDDALASVAFEVNGSSFRPESEPRGGRAIALKVRSIMRADAASRPDGFKYVTSAARGDGLQETRARLYQAAGFTATNGSARSQYGIVKNGKVTPDTASLNAQRATQRTQLTSRLRASGLSPAAINSFFNPDN
jgi:hypothetical protein